MALRKEKGEMGCSLALAKEEIQELKTSQKQYENMANIALDHKEEEIARLKSENETLRDKMLSSETEDATDKAELDLKYKKANMKAVEKKRAAKVNAMLELRPTPGETPAGQESPATPNLPLEPDNEQCCKHYVEAIKNGSYTPLEACTGNRAFDRHMQGLLQDILKDHGY